MPAFTGRTLAEMVALSGEVYPSSTHTDGTFPRRFWVSGGGSDGVGNGSFVKPFLTVRRAIRQTVDGRGDWIFVGPGIYRETPDIGSGGTASGDSGGYAKRDLHIVGTGSANVGRTQIIGDGTSELPTIRVQSGYLRGFFLKNLTLDNSTSADAGRAFPCLELVTSDTGTLTATSSDEWAKIEDVDIISDSVVTTGILLTGTTMAEFRRLTVAGCVVGIGWRGSANNYPEHVKFWDVVFQDNTTADIASYSGGENIGSSNATNLQFFRPMFMDRGGTPVTNYANIAGTYVNCGFYEFDAARDVADDTLMALPVNWIAIGRSAAAAEFIIGA